MLNDTINTVVVFCPAFRLGAVIYKMKQPKEGFHWAESVITRAGT